MAQYPRNLTAFKLADVSAVLQLSELELLFGDAAKLDALQVIVFFLVR